MPKMLMSCLLAIFVACGNISDKHTQSSASMEEHLVMEEPPRTQDAPAPPEVEHKIIKTGNLELEVSKLNVAKVNIDTLLKEYKGYYESERYNSYHNRISYSLVIRVPQIHFEALVTRLENGTGRLLSKNINARDVTEEYVDLNLRLDNKLAYLSQYNEILKQAESIKEILEVQEKIRTIEEEIESAKGRLNYLDNKVNFSTLTVEIAETKSRAISGQPSFGKRLLHAFKSGVEGFFEFLLVVVKAWPFILLAFLLWIFRKKIKFPWRSKK